MHLCITERQASTMPAIVTYAAIAWSVRPSVTRTGASC